MLLDSTRDNFVSPSFRQVPTFGQATIRRFSANSSEMKKMAARDFEDLLLVGSSLLTLCVFLAKIVTISVRSQFSMDSYLNHSIATSCNCCLFVPIGTD